MENAIAVWLQSGWEEEKCQKKESDPDASPEAIGAAEHKLLDL
jgi:hypothetical protein